MFKVYPYIAEILKSNPKYFLIFHDKWILKTVLEYNSTSFNAPHTYKWSLCNVQLRGIATSKSMLSNLKYHKRVINFSVYEDK